MKSPLTLSALRVVLTILILLVGSGTFSRADNPPCEVAPKLARTNGASWPPGTPITVVINSSHFATSAEQDAIKQAFRIWQDANPNSAVTFTFTAATQQPPPGQDLNTNYVHRFNSPTGAESNIAFTGSATSEGNRTTSAVTAIDPTVTRLQTITQLMLHEIGHTFGLDDCLDCTHASTIMSRPAGLCNCPAFTCDTTVPKNNIYWGCPILDGPRQCDVNTVAQRAGYPAPPTPRPPTCTYQEDERTPNRAFCDINAPLCEDGENNDCDNGTDWNDEGCICMSPIVVDTLGNGFKLTSVSDGVAFDLVGTGRRVQVSWIQDDDAWLVLDRNGNGLIDDGKELFGNFTPQPLAPRANGFVALAEYDKAGEWWE